MNYLSYYRIPSNCAYTSSSAIKNDYFNSGLIVLTPSQKKFRTIVSRLYTISDLSVYPFPDQDFLNEVFANKWTTLPYVYNSLKPLSYAHASMWDIRDVKNIHYILIPKPWDLHDEDGNEKKEAELDEMEKRYYPQHRLWWDTHNALGKDTISNINKALEQPPC